MDNSLQEEGDDSSEEWEMIDLQGLEDVVSNNSNKRNLYRHQLSGVNANDLPPDSLKEPISGLPVPTLFSKES